MPLAPVASTDAWLSQVDDIALVSQQVVCGIDSYETQVRCTDRAGSPVGIFGREGEGPDEFGDLSAIERGPDGTVGIIDLKLNRLSVYTPSGALVSQAGMPPRFAPHYVAESSVFGIGVEWPDGAVGDGGTWVTKEVDAVSGELLWERPDIDVWSGQIYIGTVRIRDRLLGYDLLGTTLVALVERKPDRYGIAGRAVDWYEITSLDFGS